MSNLPNVLRAIKSGRGVSLETIVVPPAEDGKKSPKQPIAIIAADSAVAESLPLTRAESDVVRMVLARPTF